MTTKTAILQFLTLGDDWLDKQDICDFVRKATGKYTDTVSRALRQLTKEGKIIRRNYESKKGSQYFVVVMPEGAPNEPELKIEQPPSLFQVKEGVEEVKNYDFLRQ